MSTSSPPSNGKRVAIIGGGAGGIIASRELLKEGHQVTVFEQGSSPGGLWLYSDNTDIDTNQAHSSCYKGLRTNLPRQVMSFLDHPFFDSNFPGSNDPRTFPAHDEVLAYLLAYGKEHDVFDHFSFCSRVVSALHTSNGWKIIVEKNTISSSIEDYGTVREELFDALIVCNGHFSKPRIPSFPGQHHFPGLQLHSHNYRVPDEYVDKSVVLIGASNSGTDIAAELDGVCSRVYLCSKDWLIPGGVGEDGECSAATNGSIAMEQQPRTTGNVIDKPNIKELRSDGSVVFEDDSVADNINVVMYCTGFEYSVPFLQNVEDAPKVAPGGGALLPIYKHLFPVPRQLANKLSFVGLPWKVIPFPQMQLQTRLVARILSGRVELPSQEEMERDQVNPSSPDVKYTHRMAGDVQWEYNAWLVKACGDVEAWPTERVEMYEACGRNRRENLETYRDIPLVPL
jgi:hypothetical protein